MATHSSIVVWEIPWTEEPGGLQSMGLHRPGGFVGRAGGLAGRRESCVPPPAPESGL